MVRSITDDGTVTLKVLYAINASAFQTDEEDDQDDSGFSMDETNTDEEKESLESLGFKVTDYTDDNGYVGIVATKSYKLAEISGKDPITVDLAKIADESFSDKQFFQEVKSNHYKATFVMNFAEDGAEMMASMSSAFDFSYSVTLPNKAISHNAEEVDGNTLTWKPKYGQNTAINFEFKTGSDSNMIYYAIAVGFLGVSIVVLAFAIISKKKKSK